MVKKMVGLESPPQQLKDKLAKRSYLHLGCGDRVLPGFINVDFLPGDDGVIGWNLLDPWPAELKGMVRGIFSEDVFEHFYYEEQMYLLCEANICLQNGAVNRILMPNFDKVISTLQSNLENSSYWQNLYAAETPVDLVNVMLRHSGHRWLHNFQSLSPLAEKCGYEAISTNCAESTDPALSNLNLRSEKDSFSFATDLRKIRTISKSTYYPSQIVNATLIEGDEQGGFYRSTSDDPMIIYDFPNLTTEQVVLVNARCFNIAPAFEHNITKFYFGESEDQSFFNDRSLLSVTTNNFVQGNIIRRLIGQNCDFNIVRVDPVDTADSIFYAGKLEIHFFTAG